MNHLRSEQSPYLLQHVDNPVDWHPWGESAFSLARNKQKLIFLSIGYSTCHWCHVMAHESFEDDEVAELLNQDYVSIKVDREERPDIDQIYMDVCQRLTGSGGWPLTVIMTPDALPFYAATYIPKEGRHGRPGLMNLLPWVADKWRKEPGMLLDAAQEAVASLQKVSEPSSTTPITPEIHSKAEVLLKNSYDRIHGGFARAPKFPRPHDLTFLLHRYRMSGAKECLSMVEQTLMAMRCGGIYDQLGFGFHRYSTDEAWLLPHFEKMLYDQAGLVLAYLAAWQVTGRDIYATTVREVLKYLTRDMRASNGGFFSAEDADSEGEEGRFYLWTRREIDALLASESNSFCSVYNVAEVGNYLDESTGRKTGNNILHLSPGEIEKSLPIFAESRETLLQSRQERIRPHLDDKILAAWNGMVISALAEAGRLLVEDTYLALARQSAAFVMDNMSAEGRLYRRYRNGHAAVNGFAEDYAYMARGLLDLYNANFEVLHLEQAFLLGNALRSYFLCPESGRLFDTPSDGEELLVRPSSPFDGAMPSAGAVAVEVFARLYLLSGDPCWREAADALLQSVGGQLERYPAGYTQWLQSSRWLILPTRVVVVVGNRNDSSTESMLAAVREADSGQTVFLFRSSQEDNRLLALAPFLGEMKSEPGLAKAYLCEEFTCKQPVNCAEELVEMLKVEL